MGRWADLESDEHRLPEDFERVGYDADTQKYTFLERSTGRYYESSSGNRYGVLNPVSQHSRSPSPSPEIIEQRNAQIKKGNKEAVRLMLPFALLVLVFLVLMFKFVNSGSGSGTDHKVQVHCGEGAHAVEIKEGDTCWGVAEAHGLGVNELLKLTGNEGVDCDSLDVGSQICVPTPAAI